MRYVAALLFVCACNPEVEFDVDVDGDTTVEQGTLLEDLLAQFGFGSFVTFDLSQAQEFRNNDVRKDQVTSTRLTKLNLAIAAPDGQTFEFLDRISFSAEAPGVEQRTVATKEVDPASTQFDCDLVDLDLAEYVHAESMSLTTDVTGRRPDVDTTVHAAARFHVKARVLQ